jgi:hypothetical protein
MIADILLIPIRLETMRSLRIVTVSSLIGIGLVALCVVIMKLMYNIIIQCVNRKMQAANMALILIRVCYTIGGMSGSKPIPTRFSEDLLQRMDSCAKKSGLENRTAVVKFCVATFLDHFERSGEASLPPNWKEILRELDGRTFRYADKRIAAESEPQYKTEKQATKRQHAKPK